MFLKINSLLLAVCLITATISDAQNIPAARQVPAPANQSPLQNDPYLGALAKALGETSTKRIDINGNWEITLRLVDGTSHTTHLKIVVRGNDVTGEVPEYGITYRGRFTSDSVIDGIDYEGPKATTPETLTILDPDHFRGSVSGFAFHRSDVHADDYPCDSQNPYHITPEYQFLRGRAAILEKKDFNKASCWFALAANQGHARSQALLAALLFKGRGMEPDVDQAFNWADKSAKQGDFFGEITLAAIFSDEKGPYSDPKKAQSWYEKGLADMPTIAGPQGTKITGKDLMVAGGIAIAALAVLGLLFESLTGTEIDSSAAEKEKRLESLIQFCRQNPYYPTCSAH